MILQDVSFCIFFFWFNRRVIFSEIRNDTELDTKYVRVLDPRAQEISFVRTDCPKRETLYVSCSNLGKSIETYAVFGIFLGI